MKTIGLVGGISWTSTIDYYRIINEETNKRLGGLNFATCIIYSVNFDNFRKANAAHDWDATAAILSKAAMHLKQAGAELIMLGANTAHIVAERVSRAVGLPLIDIRIATACAINAKKIKKIGLLGTAYTMELEFYIEKLCEHGIEVIVPANVADRKFIEETLLYELGRGIIKQETKETYKQISNTLIARGAAAIVLGCTEIPLLLQHEDFNVPVFNTTQIHAQAAVEFALSN